MSTKNQFNVFKYVYDRSNFIIKIEDAILDNYEIDTLKLSFEANTHSKLNLIFENHKNQNIYLALKNEKYPKIEIKLLKDEVETMFFTGQIELFNIGHYGSQGHKIEIEALSVTKILDRESKFRAYQDINLTLLEIMQDITSENKNIKFIFNDILKTIKIEKPIIQYNESDWEFIIRVASHAGLGVYPLANRGIAIGLNNGTSQEKSVAVLDNLWQLSKNQYGDIGYIFNSQNLLLCGDEIVLWTNLEKEERVRLNIHSGEIDLVKSITSSKVSMIQETYKYPYITNKNIAGKVIEGRVEKVFSEDEIAKMTVNLSEGLKKTADVKPGFKYKPKKAYLDTKGRFNFPYMTPYSQTNTGLFCTPEINDRVSIYYPTEEEIESYVMGSVNNSGNGRFSNPTERNFSIKDKNKNIFHLYINNDYLSVDNTETVIRNKEMIDMSSQNIITISSDKILELLSKENLRVSSKEMNINHKTKTEIGDVIKSKGSTNTLEFPTVTIKGDLKSS
ncbi:hypothetical protein H3N56_11555 [Cetobacterium sp. 2A]|uniref:contractile injection system protein, VgrG/Pvc8 family n=1 Tax=Cetobacterium sp. 2A TaxID=2754723 RepID=UPI00163BFC70|nr:contractile injection system protein, VgrG/Pvc8 family [Cetobacterium sp. 2A]MBC2857068.1 hypothetical protein [Cetobacterium sp. 2A]